MKVAGHVYANPLGGVLHARKVGSIARHTCDIARIQAPVGRAFMGICTYSVQSARGVVM